MAVDEHALALSLGEFGRGNARALSLGHLVTQLSQVVGTARAMLGVDGVGVLLKDDADRVRPVAAAGPMAAALESAQEEFGVGPGMDALSSGSTVSVSDLPTDSAYAGLWDALEGTGVHAVLSVPIEIDGEVAGNLNALEAEPHTWSEAEIAATAAFAAILGTLLGLGGRVLERAAASPRITS